MTKRLLAIFCFLGIAAALLVACSASQNNALAVTHVTLIDATGAPPNPDMTLLITDQRIATIGPSNSTAIPRGAQILDATGKFLIPGLADMHIHLTGAGEPTGSRDFMLPLLVAHGITTVRDMGGAVDQLTALRQEESGKQIGPRVFFTGPYASSASGHKESCRIPRQTTDTGHHRVRQIRRSPPSGRESPRRHPQHRENPRCHSARQTAGQRCSR